MGLLRFYSATIRLLCFVLRLVRVRLGLFSRVLVILSILILTTQLAYPQAINIHNGRAYMPISEVSPDGVQRIRYLNGGFDAIYHPAKDLSRIRSAASGATAVARVPAVVSRTVPATRVAGGILSKARYLKAGGLPGLVITTVAPIVIEKLLEDNGYRYDYDQKDFVDIREYKIVIGFNDENSKWHTVAVGGLSKEAVGMGRDYYLPHYVDPLCRVAWNKAKDSPPFKEWAERGYEYSGVDRYSQSCNVLKGEDGRGLLSYEIEENKSHPITEQQFQEIIQPYMEKDPEAWVKAAELPDSAWGAPKVLITQETVVNSEPYTDSRDGKAKQSLFRLWPCGNETCATETIKDRPDLKPNSPEAPAATPGGNAGTGSGGQSGNQSGNGDKDQTEQQKPFDLCREHPEVMACDQQPEPEDADLTIPKETVNLDFKPENVFSTDAACPKGEEFEAFGGRFSISLEPACAAARKIRPFIIVGAWLVAAFFVARVVRQEV